MNPIPKIPAGGNFAILNNFRAAEKMIEKGSEKNVLAALAAWHKGLMKVLSGPRSGRIYRVPLTRKLYTASAPGEAPATATSTLRTTYKFLMEKLFPVPVGMIGSPQDYAPKLEFGTSKMAPRPHLKRAYNDNKKEILEKLSQRMHK